MQDRVSQYPGRIKLTPVSGQENVYDMEWADGATVEGTALNKANLLSDSTAALYGLDSDAVPDDVLSLVADQIGGFKIVNSYQITPNTEQAVQIELNSLDPTKLYYLRMTASDVDNNSYYLISFSATAVGSNSYLSACVTHFKQGTFTSDSNYYVSSRFGYHPEFLISLRIYNYPDETTAASFMGWSDEETLRWVGIRTTQNPLRLNFSCTSLTVGTINLELLERLV